MIYEDDKYYHVYNRDAHKRNIFQTEENFLFCEQLLLKYYVQYKVSVVSYCLMPNHYHFLLMQNSDGSISRFIQTVFNSYTQAFNKINNHSGTLFQGKAKSIEVGSDEYAVRLCCYIHRNPIKAGLVTGMDDWKYSSHTDWSNKKNASFIDFRLRDGYFDGAEKYYRFMQGSKEDVDIKKYLFD